ncbi:MAG: sodium:proton antiporter [Thermoplasmata archaeon]|nr:MAG: sodium:proton antiporter [Thermoplasmata archaeon]
MAMSKIVRTVSNLLYFFILIFGFYIVMHGHLTPGGGFQGGAVLASAIALIIVAHGIEKAKKFYSEFSLTSCESLGLVLFISLAFLGIFMTFFYNFLSPGAQPAIPIFSTEPPLGPNLGNLNTGGVIPLMNIAVGIEVIGGLGAIVYVMFRGGKK